MERVCSGCGVEIEEEFYFCSKCRAERDSFLNGIRSRMPLYGNRFKGGDSPVLNGIADGALGLLRCDGSKQTHEVVEVAGD